MRFMATAKVGTTVGEVCEVITLIMSWSEVVACKVLEKELSEFWSRLLRV